MDGPIVKIVKQDDEFVTLESCFGNPVQQTVGIDYFESIAIDNKDGTYTLDFSRLSEEDQLELNRLTEELDVRLKWLIPHTPAILKAINAKNLHNMGILGSVTRKYLEEFPTDVHADFITNVNHIRFNILGIERPQ